MHVNVQFLLLLQDVHFHFFLAQGVLLLNMQLRFFEQLNVLILLFRLEDVVPQVMQHLLFLFQDVVLLNVQLQQDVQFLQHLNHEVL
eukprot:UN10813